MSAEDADFKFWALTIPKNSEKALKMENNNSVYHVSNATLGNKVWDGRTTVYFKANGKKAPICNLINNTLENASLDLIVSRSMNASFVSEGVNDITVSGYVQPLVDEDGDSDYHDVSSLNAHDVSSLNASEAKEQAHEEEMPQATAVKSVVEEEKESKKRKIEEIETDDAAKPPQKKRDKKKKKKKKIQKTDVAAESSNAKDVKAKGEKVNTEDLAVPAGESNKVAQPKKAAKEATEAPKKKDKSKKSKKMVDAGEGVKYRVLKKGKAGVNPAKKGDSITLLYVGCLKDGKQFDKNLKEGYTFEIGGDEVIPGIELGVMGMCLNEKRRIIIPPEQGYGEDGASEGAIPPNAELTFTVQRKQ